MSFLELVLFARVVDTIELACYAEVLDMLLMLYSVHNKALYSLFVLALVFGLHRQDFRIVFGKEVLG